MKTNTPVLSTLFALLAVLAAGCSNMAIPAQSTQEPTAQTELATAPGSPPTEQSTTGDNTPFIPGSDPIPVEGSYVFAEGPAADPYGNVYFSDVNAGRIYRWSPDGSVTVFVDGLNDPNGLAFDENGVLIVCEGGNGRLISLDSQGQMTILTDQYDGLRFNEPNDLWIDPQGGIYFTDPAYQSPVVQDGEHVYYLLPDRSQVMRVISDMVRPNGIVGTSDGKKLYVTDHGAGQTFTYQINADGTLTDKKIFVSVGSDGMELDGSGNLYLTTPNNVQIYDPDGIHVGNIPIQENPTNLAFTGRDEQTLFITARTAVYIVQTAAGTPGREDTPADLPDTSNFILTSPDISEGGYLPIEYTCDGSASTLALAWSGAPVGSAGYAVVMHHVASPEDIHWYLVLYDIPADVTNLPKNFSGFGTLGTNSVNDRTEYAPPCSKGPGPKEYIYTVYALSAQPQIDVSPAQVNRAVLLDAIRGITLASAELHVIYTRP